MKTFAATWRQSLCGVALAMISSTPSLADAPDVESPGASLVAVLQEGDERPRDGEPRAEGEGERPDRERDRPRERDAEPRPGRERAEVDDPEGRRGEVRELRRRLREIRARLAELGEADSEEASDLKRQAERITKALDDQARALGDKYVGDKYVRRERERPGRERADGDRAEGDRRDGHRREDDRREGDRPDREASPEARRRDAEKIRARLDAIHEHIRAIGDNDPEEAERLKFEAMALATRLHEVLAPDAERPRERRDGDERPIVDRDTWKARHVRSAIDHLRAAGMQDAADDLYRENEEILRKLPERGERVPPRREDRPGRPGDERPTNPNNPGRPLRPGLADGPGRPDGPPRDGDRPRPGRRDGERRDGDGREGDRPREEELKRPGRPEDPRSDAERRKEEASRDAATRETIVKARDAALAAEKERAREVDLLREELRVAQSERDLTLLQLVDIADRAHVQQAEQQKLREQAEAAKQKLEATRAKSDAARLELLAEGAKLREMITSLQASLTQKEAELSELRKAKPRDDEQRDKEAQLDRARKLLEDANRQLEVRVREERRLRESMDKVAPPKEDDAKRDSSANPANDIRSELAKRQADENDNKANLERAELDLRNKIEDAKRAERTAHEARAKQTEIEISALRAKVDELLQQTKAQAAELQKLREREKKSDGNQTIAPPAAELEAQRLKLEKSQQLLEEAARQFQERQDTQNHQIADGMRAEQSKIGAARAQFHKRLQELREIETQSSRSQKDPARFAAPAEAAVDAKRREFEDAREAYQKATTQLEAREAAFRELLGTRKAAIQDLKAEIRRVMEASETGGDAHAKQSDIEAKLQEKQESDEAAQAEEQQHSN